MKQEKPIVLRKGWTTGACATAAVKGALVGLWGGEFLKTVSLVLPKGETPTFDLVQPKKGVGWSEVGIIKDAGDDPDVTHGCLVIARVKEISDSITFKAGKGVGTVTMPGLPIGVGEPAINLKPREMMSSVVYEMAKLYLKKPNVEITISIPNGEIITKKTWNPRLGIVGGLSILGTTGIVRPFSCSAWIASIHRGIDVARAAMFPHVAGCTGSTSEGAVQKLFNLPDQAMLDMGDFAGGMIKYLNKNPVSRVTIGGGIGKITKFAFGAVDLHSKRSQVNFKELSQLAQNNGLPNISNVNTALEALELAGNDLAILVANLALQRLESLTEHSGMDCGIVIVNRTGDIISRVGN